MTRYQVDSDAVAAATGIVRSAMGRLQGEVNGLHGHLVALQNSWTGPASAGFQVVVNDWKLTQQRVEESLAMLGAALDRAGQQYAEVEAQNARLFLR
jgi:WXG100 family type VII secretion target